MKEKRTTGHNDYEELRELGNVFMSQGLPKEVLAELKTAHESGASLEELVELSRKRLSATGDDGATFLEAIPEEVRGMIPPEQLEAVEKIVDLSYLKTLADADSGEHAPAMFQQLVDTFGIRVQEEEVDGVPVKFVMAIIYPFINPEAQIARLIETCYQVYPPELFKRSRNSERDSMWYRRNREGESYREIALSDTRSGITPEAQANPDEYADEVETAESRVAKAVQRFHSGWTKKLGMVSTDSE